MQKTQNHVFFPFLLVPIWILQIFCSFNGGPPWRFPSEGGKRMNVKSEKRKKRLNSRCGSAEICAEISPEIDVNIFQWWLRGVHENLQAVLYRLYAWSDCVGSLTDPVIFSWTMLQLSNHHGLHGRLYIYSEMPCMDYSLVIKHMQWKTHHL